MRFFGKIRDWISDPRSNGFLATKETKNPFSDYFCHFPLNYADLRNYERSDEMLKLVFETNFNRPGFM